MSNSSSKARKQLTPEEQAYEIADIWDENWFSKDDVARLPDITSQIPASVVSLLDAGCGNGLFLHHLMKNAPQIQRLCGAERSSAALQHVRVEKVQASIDSMPFDDLEFDLVSSQEVLEHLPQKIYFGALSELSRIAKDYILITVPFAQDLSVGRVTCPKCTCQFNADYHVRSFNQATMQTLFNSHGFTCENIFYVLPRRVMHDPLAKLVDVGRYSFHKFVRGFDAVYPGFAVCPACGYRDEQKTLGGSGFSSGKKSFFGSAVKLLMQKKTHRWIGGLYRRR